MSTSLDFEPAIGLVDKSMQSGPRPIRARWRPHASRASSTLRRSPARDRGRRRSGEDVFPALSLASRAAPLETQRSAADGEIADPTQCGRRSERIVSLHGAHSGAETSPAFMLRFSPWRRGLKSPDGAGRAARRGQRRRRGAAAWPQRICDEPHARTPARRHRRPAARSGGPWPRADAPRRRASRPCAGDRPKRRLPCCGPPSWGRTFRRLERTFTIRANDGFVEAFGARLVAAMTDAAPGVRLRFAPKPDKDVRALREGLVDLEVGVLGEAGPEVRVQALFRDRFVGVVRGGSSASRFGRDHARALCGVRSCRRLPSREHKRACRPGAGRTWA